MIHWRGRGVQAKQQRLWISSENPSLRQPVMPPIISFTRYLRPASRIAALLAPLSGGRHNKQRKECLEDTRSSVCCNCVVRDVNGAGGVR